MRPDGTAHCGGGERKRHYGYRAQETVALTCPDSRSLWIEFA